MRIWLTNGLPARSLVHLLAYSLTLCFYLHLYFSIVVLSSCMCIDIHDEMMVVTVFIIHRYHHTKVDDKHNAECMLLCIVCRCHQIRVCICFVAVINACICTCLIVTRTLIVYVFIIHCRHDKLWIMVLTHAHPEVDSELSSSLSSSITLRYAC